MQLGVQLVAEPTAVHRIPVEGADGTAYAPIPVGSQDQLIAPWTRTRVTLDERLQDRGELP
ncbi:hypothetical protein SCANM63S_03561 [Streptomyces canarius]